LDVKDSELFRKSTKLGDANVEKFDPSAFDGSTWGFDPFYRLHQGCTDFEILDSMQIVANSLIPMPPDTKDPFWKNNAKNMFLGLAIKFYKDGSHDLVSISDKILGKPIEDNIDYVLGNSQPCDAEYKYLIMFQNMEAVTLYGVYAELASNLTVFANHPGIRYAFGPGSRRKITPLDLEEKKRIFICVNETEITTLSGVTKMILDVMLYGLQMRMKGREESEVDPVLFIIDELPQLLMNGPLNQLIQGLRVLRSFKVRMVLAFQTRESLETAFSSSQVTDLISNTNYMIVLNGGNSTGTLKMICDLVGQFKEKHESYQGAGNNRKTTVSYEDKDIIEPSDINRLPLENKALILSPTGWMIVKKSPYYKCKYLAGKAEEILRYNKNVMEAESQAEAEPEGRKTQVEQQLDLWCTYKKREMKKGEKENDE
jgi:type IV secretory pathway TraG/TraD family ATPase VirD4